MLLTQSRREYVFQFPEKKIGTWQGITASKQYRISVGISPNPIAPYLVSETWGSKVLNHCTYLIFEVNIHVFYGLICSLYLFAQCLNSLTCWTSYVLYYNTPSTFIDIGNGFFWQNGLCHKHCVSSVDFLNSIGRLRDPLAHNCFCHASKDSTACNTRLNKASSLRCNFNTISHIQHVCKQSTP